MFGKIREALSLEKWVENFEGYLDARIELAKYDAREAMVELLSKGIIWMVLSMLGLTSLLCLNFALGYWLSSLFGNSYGGFFVLTGFYGLLFLLIFISRTNQNILMRIEKAIRLAMKQPKADELITPSAGSPENTKL